jgi:Putative MetA-pathway of phenol degradation
MHIRLFAFVVVICVFPVAAHAQQRPLVTEDPETIGAGRVLIEAGLDYASDVEYPASGLEGDLFRFPLVGVSVGVSSIAEIQIDGGLYSRLSITDRREAPLSSMVTATGDSTSSIDDLVIGTKVRIVPEGVSRPSFALRFATKLPNASNESGLGLDTTDFFASLLVAKTVQSVRVVGNAGLGILADPTRGDRQNDVLTYGLSFARAVTQAGEVVGEINGRADTRAGDPPPGTESRGSVRFGGRYTIGTLRADAALFFGITSSDPGIGFALGFTYVFNAFQIP